MIYNDDLAQSADKSTSKDTLLLDKMDPISFVCPKQWVFQKMIVHPHEQFAVQNSGTYRELNSFWVPENVNTEMKNWLQVYCFHL